MEDFHTLIVYREEGIDINVAGIEEETTSQSAIGLTLEVCLEIDDPKDM